MKVKLSKEEHDKNSRLLKEKRKTLLKKLDECEEKIQFHASYGKYVMPKIWHTKCLNGYGGTLEKRPLI